MKSKKPPSLEAPSVQPLLAAPASTISAFPIAGIGASAGGLEAFEQFFCHVLVNSGVAFVLVSHLDPNHDSLLTEILQRTTSIPIVEAQDQMLVEPNHVYVIPPNRDIEIFHGALQLSLPKELRGHRLPIDVFLSSLAEDQKTKAVGIILSGTGTDGTLGCGAIIAAGGITLVQEPSTAKYDGMPCSVIAAGYATHILSVNTMPEALGAIFSKKNIPIEAVPIPIATSGMNRILMQLRMLTGHDFSLYKKSTIGRRIVRRMLQNNIEDTDTYARYLKENPAETRLLFKELLINVTSFFRDAEAFDILKRDILPELCKGKSDDYVFRAWVAGCSTGEEAYSIAILLHELMEVTHQVFKVQIYSTDLAEDAITMARAGIYPANIAEDVSPERLRRYFIKEDNCYRIKKEIREMIVFAIQNVIKDPPFTKLDLLSCRNLMIYLEPELQNRLLPSFHYALKPRGVLFLSPSESIGNHFDLFLALNRKWKFYRVSHVIPPVHEVATQNLSWVIDNSAKAPAGIVMPRPKEANFADLTRRMLVQYFAPASIITDTKGETLYVYGETGRYLRPAPGQPSHNVIEMAREGLEQGLRNAIYAAATEGAATLNRELLVKTNGGFSTISLSVRPLPNSDRSHNLLLISFQDVATPVVKAVRKRAAKPAEQSRIEELERDLAYLKETHQASLEEQQASNEELKSSNEEIQSTNEELQSTNEELETSKEELQSINEELITVNSELEAKIEQLAEMQNDMKNLLDNINIGIIFLDRHLKIRSFTSGAVSIYRLVASDAGRPLTDIRSVPEGDDLLVAAQVVLDSLIPYEREIRINEDTWILARIQPYRTLESMIDGVVLTFTDITARFKDLATQSALSLAEGIVDTVREPLIVLDGELKVISASQSFYQQFQVKPEVTVGRQIYELGNGQWNIPALRTLLEDILPSDNVFEDYVVEHDFPVLGRRKILLNARRIISKINEPSLILLSMEVRS